MTAFIWGVAAAVRQLNQDAVSRALAAERGFDERQMIPEGTSVKRGGDGPHGEGGSRKRQKNCFICGQAGHVRAGCPQRNQKVQKKKIVKAAPRQGQRKWKGFRQRRPGLCDKCGQPGHIGRDCRNCFNCGQPGHTRRRCPLADRSRKGLRVQVAGSPPPLIAQPGLQQQGLQQPQNRGEVLAVPQMDPGNSSAGVNFGVGMEERDGTIRIG